MSKKLLFKWLSVTKQISFKIIYLILPIAQTTNLLSARIHYANVNVYLTHITHNFRPRKLSIQKSILNSFFQFFRQKQNVRVSSTTVLEERQNLRSLCEGLWYFVSYI